MTTGLNWKLGSMPTWQSAVFSFTLTENRATWTIQHVRHMGKPLTPFLYEESHMVDSWHAAHMAIGLIVGFHHHPHGAEPPHISIHRHPHGDSH